MSDAKHTPGPWKYGPDNRKTMRVFSGSREIVRALSTHGNRRLNCVERAANARLISKAPEMRDLIFELFEDPDVQLILGGNPNRIRALTDRAVALIDYLKGETS